MITKAFNSFKTKLASSAAASQSTTKYVYNQDTKVDTEGLPLAPRSAFRKRPTKLTYDPNEYHMFRLPSEETFLLGGIDKDELFGKRKGITHSPHIMAQTEMDSNMLWGIGVFMVLLAAYEVKGHHDFKNLRENFRNSDMGKFKVSDFK